MSTVVFAQNLTLVANTTSLTLYSDPYPVDQYNHAQGVVKTNGHFTKGSSPAATVRPQGSNDGVVWNNIGSATTISVAPGSSTPFDPSSADVYYSFYRLEYTVIDGTDWCMYNIDVHVCFKHV